jgi:hypothetical protein
MLGQHLGRQGRSKICIVFLDHAQRVVTLDIMDAVIRRFATRLVPDLFAIQAIPVQEPQKSRRVRSNRFAAFSMVSVPLMTCTDTSTRRN